MCGKWLKRSAIQILTSAAVGTSGCIVGHSESAVDSVQTVGMRRFARSTQEATVVNRLALSALSHDPRGRGG
jgi:hypothetical protein